MGLRAAFFDVGDTLVEHWAPRETVRAKTRERICSAVGEQPWIDALVAADVEPERAKRGWPYDPENERQETNAWYEAWFRANGFDLDGIDLDRVRSLFCVPLEEVSVPAPGAFEAVRWCKTRGLHVVLVTNTLSRGDEEVLDDWRRFGLDEAIDGVVSSHSTGWRKPHPAIFERALELAGARPDQAFHVGDNIVADVWGARQLGIRTIWRRVAEPRADVRVVPDAIVREMSEVPGIVSAWLAAR